MKLKVIFSCLVLIQLLFSSCKHDKAYLQVVNKVHNVRLENISYCGFALGSSLLPGESTKVVEFSEEYDGISFPLKGPLEFYMTSGENRVLLKTKELYQLDAGQTLVIEITDETEVINPLTSFQSSELSKERVVEFE